MSQAKTATGTSSAGSSHGRRRTSSSIWLASERDERRAEQEQHRKVKSRRDVLRGEERERDARAPRERSDERRRNRARDRAGRESCRACSRGPAREKHAEDEHEEPAASDVKSPLVPVVGGHPHGVHAIALVGRRQHDDELGEADHLVRLDEPGHVAHVVDERRRASVPTVRARRGPQSRARRAGAASRRRAP